MAAKKNESEHIFVRRVLIVLGLATVFFLVWQLRILLLMLFGAIVVASIFRAIADLLCKYGRLSNAVATGLSILLILGSIAALIALFGQQVGQQVQGLRETLPDAWRDLEARIGDMGLSDQMDRLMASITTPGGGSLSGFGRTLLSIGSGLADLLVVIFAGIYLATQPNFYRIGAIKLVPPTRRKIAAEAMLESERALRLWLKGQAIAMVVVGLLTGIGLWALGMPSALALGLLAGLWLTVAAVTATCFGLLAAPLASAGL